MIKMQPYVHTVQYYETDQMGIAHHSNYIRWMEEARVAYLDRVGLGYDALEAQGILSPVIGLECTYRHPTAFRDSVEIQTEIEAYDGVTVTVRYTMQKAENTVLEGRTRHCFTDRSGKPILLKKRFPLVDEQLRRLLSR